MNAPLSLLRLVSVARRLMYAPAPSLAVIPSLVCLAVPYDLTQGLAYLHKVTPTLHAA